jgi:predicted GNAT family acetyltransferase
MLYRPRPRQTTRAPQIASQERPLNETSGSAERADRHSVEHEPARHRFVITFPQGEGELVYRRSPSGALDLVHTGVDPRLRRRGVGAQLARAAFAFARANGLRVIPTCPFIARWLAKHPEEQDLVASMLDRAARPE